METFLTINNPIIPAKIRVCVLWERVNSAFTPGSADSAVDTGCCHLGSDRPG